MSSSVIPEGGRGSSSSHASVSPSGNLQAQGRDLPETGLGTLWFPGHVPHTVVALCSSTSSFLWYQTPAPALPTLRKRCQPCSTYPIALGDADEFVQAGLTQSAGAQRRRGAAASAMSLSLALVQRPGEAWGG